MNTLFTTKANEVDKEYSQVTSCPVCKSEDLFFVCLTNGQEGNLIEILKECQTCGEIFATIYDENKRIVGNRESGTAMGIRERWLKKQKKT